MKRVSHTNPYTGESTGQLFTRGPIVAADGGRANAVDSDRDDDERRMKDVSHTPPKEAEDANRVFERGGSEDDVAYEYEE